MMDNIYKCIFCGNNDVDGLEFNKHDNGFWCEWCDGYTNLNNDHTFKVLLEDKKEGSNVKVVKKAHLSKRLSPLRYPGGKSKIIDFLYEKLNLNKSDIFVEAFAGGSSFGLSLIEAGVIDKLILNDLDFGVYSLFLTIKHDHQRLINRIQSAELNHDLFFSSQKVVKGKYKGSSTLDAAWDFLVVNRLAYSGIFSANPMGGKGGPIDKLLQRWNPKTLVDRINKIHNISDKIEIYNEDSLDIIEKYYWYDKCTIFIDPPYIRKGKDLYNHFFTKEDHVRLANLLESLNFSAGGADLLVTYDFDELIDQLYSLPEIELIRRVYSI